MNTSTSQAIFLITGLVTAAGAHKEHSTLKLAQSLVEEEQYIAAIYTAEQIIEHYPQTTYAQSAENLIEVIRNQYLDRPHRLN